MDRLIWIAWRAFWVGLGASAVLIGQSLATPTAPAAPVADPIEAPLSSPPTMRPPVTTRGAQPNLPRTPLDSNYEKAQPGRKPRA